MNLTIEKSVTESFTKTRKLARKEAEEQLSLKPGKADHDQIDVGAAITPVPKCEHGGDIVQRVMLPARVACGTILWESKRSRNWSNVWLAKLRKDQRQA